MGGEQQAKKPCAVPLECRLIGVAASAMAREKRGSHQEKDNRVGREEYELLNGPHGQMLPPVHSPPDREHVREHVDCPEQLHPVEWHMMTPIDRGADAGEHVCHRQSKDH